MNVKMDSVTRFADDAIQMEFRGHVFAGRSIETVDVRVDDEGTVRVWDEIAGCWTCCHSLSQQDQHAIRLAAAD